MQNVKPVAMAALGLELAPAVVFGLAVERVARAEARFLVKQLTRHWKLFHGTAGFRGAAFKQQLPGWLRAGCACKDVAGVQ
jgi:hypothetical protein